MIHARKLARTFQVKGERVEAVRGVDLDVEPGELVAFLGPNGAGKSTSLRMLTTLLPPTSGTALVAGHDVTHEGARVRQRIGYVGQGTGSGEYLLPRDELVTQCRAYGFSRAESVRRTGELLAMLDLESLATRPAGTLSGGQRRRLDIALGLVHRPALLFLDEPSTGLDPQNRAHLWEHLLRLRRESGTTLFLTTHYLDEADTMAERVIIVDRGTIVADDTAENLKATLAGDLITLTLADADHARTAAGIADRMPSVSETTVDGTTVRVRATWGVAVLPEYLRALDTSAAPALTAEVRTPTLDDVFLALTGRRLRDGDAPEG
ncbi:ATP-binding cassette domain-containing protein [Actinoalloteichus spitiensis]|uniref:ATP-binding cassette domain-containing protein n=1 Tax=Actinoalloteichus spitiensis TaxID=252394 RepID=UPI0003820056|nr:ATP-binding cassette domain-containing protein [Actinoalloteichus spitiensis]